MRTLFWLPRHECYPAYLPNLSTGTQACEGAREAPNRNRTAEKKRHRLNADAAAQYGSGERRPVFSGGKETAKWLGLVGRVSAFLPVDRNSDAAILRAAGSRCVRVDRRRAAVAIHVVVR